MVANAAAASLGAMQTNAALRRGSFVPSVRGVATVAPPRRLTRARFPVVRAAQGPAESNEDYEARLHAEATAAVERRILKVVPADLLGSIAIPQKLVEIRSYVRWEEAGKPEDTSREWQAREYQAALIDLKLEMLAGGNLNDVRRRYQLDTEFGEDSPVHSPSKEELEMLKKALAISKEPDYYSDEKAQEEIDAEAAALAARVAAASAISAPGPAMPPPPPAAAAAAAPAPGDAKKAEKLRLKAEAEAQMKKLQEQMKALEEEEEEEKEDEDDELVKRVAAAATAVVPPPPPVPAAPSPSPAPSAKSPEAAPVFKPAGAASDTSKARALSAAKAAAEAELKAAEAEMRAAQAALKAAAAKREADAKKSATVLGDELRMGHVPADVAKSTYGVKAKAADLEAKAKAKKDAQKKVDALFIEPGVENPTQIKAEAKRLIEMELAKEEEILAAKRSAEPAKPVAVAPTPPAPPVPAAASKPLAPTAASIKGDIPELVDDVAGEVANIEDFQPKFVTGAAVDERLAKIEALHAAQLKAIKKEHEEELLKAKLSVETDGASSSAEKQLRAKLGELVRALEVSNKQCKGLKEKLAATSEELATEKKISGKAGEVLAAHKTNEMMIKTLKKELSVALEVQATAEKRAQAAEKEAAAAKVDMDVNTGKSESLEERVKELESELSEAQEVIAEFKASWEADRKVIAVLSKMKDAPEAQAKIAAAAAEESSSSSVFSKWAAGVTRVLVGEPAADVAAEKLKASAIKWSPKYDAIEAEKAKAEKAKPYARQGGSATIAMLRARKETAERAVDENARARQANWLEAAEQATEAAAAFEEEEEEEVEEPEPVKAPAPVKSNAVPAVPKARKIPLPGDKLPPAAPAKATAPSVPPPGANAVVKTAEDAVDIQKPPTATGKAAAPVPMPKPTAMPKFIPAASKAANDKKDPGGWSSAHLPPTR